MKTWTRIKDPLKWVSVACALTATSTAEYDLAVAIGMHELVAVAVPGALDAYVLRAVQRKREVFTSVLAMVGVNAVSHLHTGGVIPMGWELITGVSAIAPLVLWRVHALRSPSTARKRLLWNVPKDVPDIVLDAEHACSRCLHEHTGPCTHFAGTAGACTCGHGGTVTGCGHEHAECAGSETCTVYKPVHAPREHTCLVCLRTIPSEPEFIEHMAGHGVTDTGAEGTAEHDDLDVPDWVNTPAPAGARSLWCGLCGSRFSYDDLVSHEDVCPKRGSAPVSEWMKKVRESARDLEARSAPPVPEHAPYVDHVDPAQVVPVLRLVPEHASTESTPAEWDQEHVSTGVLHPSDTEHMDRARELFRAREHVPGVREIKAHIPSGTPRAQRLRAALKAEHASTERSTP